MALILRRISDGYNYVFEELADPRVKTFFLMDSPLPIICIAGAYLLFVLKLGPHFMKNRPAFNLDKVLIAYNLVQIVLCFYLVVMGTITIFSYNWGCEPVDYSPTEQPISIARHVWMYFMLKVADLFDTVFFVLRKKNNQITFLHLYHHTGMCFLTWIGTKYLAGGHSVFVGFLNNIVHVIMYFYYLLSAWDKQYKTNVWWKKYLTQIQILQFLIITVYFLQLLFQPDCGYPKWVVWYFVPQNIFMIVLFTNFYINSYVKPQAKPITKDSAPIPAANGLEGGKTKSQ